MVEPSGACRSNDPTLLDRQQAFGYTQEDVSVLPRADGQQGDDPIGSMGTDTPIAVLSKKPKLLYDYFKQNFAQVTNPPIDPIREELVMSLVSMIGPRPNLLGHGCRQPQAPRSRPADPDQCRVAKIRSIEAALDGAFRTATIDITWAPSEGAAGPGKALKEMCWAATEAVLADRNILILSDRAQGPDRIADAGAAGDRGRASPPDPPGPAHADRPGGRDRRAREVHHFCVLAGYGAEAINPYLAFETLEHIRVPEGLPLKPYEVQKNYIKAIGKGILKVMSKMGISTYQSYCGAQIFDAVGLSSEFIEKYFTGTATTIEGVGLARDRRGNRAPSPRRLWRQPDLSQHARCRRRCTASACAARSTPGRRTSCRLQHAVRGNCPKSTRNSRPRSTSSRERLLTIRGLMELKKADKPIDRPKSNRPARSSSASPPAR
jgi:glutamate synthase (NADPH/NADH) large chain